jgi:predicted DNA-binding protein with PD1-like motif
MQGIALALTRVHIVRVDPNEDVLIAVRRYLQEACIAQAIVLGGYGTLAAHHLHWVVDNHIPASNTYGRAEGGIEILAMNGTVVEGQPHIHVTLSTPQGAYGGHLEEGCRAYVLCEVFLGEVDGAQLKRVPTHVDVPGMGRGEVPRLQSV